MRTKPSSGFCGPLKDLPIPRCCLHWATGALWGADRDSSLPGGPERRQGGIEGVRKSPKFHRCDRLGGRSGARDGAAEHTARGEGSLEADVFQRRDHAKVVPGHIDDRLFRRQHVKRGAGESQPGHGFGGDRSGRFLPPSRQRRMVAKPARPVAPSSTEVCRVWVGAVQASRKKRARVMPVAARSSERTPAWSVVFHRRIPRVGRAASRP